MHGPSLKRCKLWLALMCTLFLSVPALAAAAPNPFVGTVSDETFESLGYMYQPGAINQIAAAGVGSLRQTFDWQYLSKGDTLNWDILDHYIGGAAQRGITIIPVLFNPPTSLTTTPPVGALRGFYPTSDPNAIGAYGAQLAARYGNTGSFWSSHPHLSPKGYAKMLCGAYRQIKAVDPNAEISTAGLPKSRIHSSIWPSKYVPRLMKAGGRGCFDTVALNAYAPTGK